MNLTGAYGILQIGILLVLLFTEPMTVVFIVIGLGCAYGFMYLSARFLFGSDRDSKADHPKN